MSVNKDGLEPGKLVTPQELAKVKNEWRKAKAKKQSKK